MDKVYIRKEDLNSWIAKYFYNDLISVDDLISVIESLDDDVAILRDKLRKLGNDEF